MVAVRFEEKDIAAMLKVPDKRDVKVDRPPEWIQWDEAFQKIRDTINKLLELVDLIPGVDPGRLPGGNLEQIVIYPFTGDWNRIRMNGDACKIWGDATVALGENVKAIPKGMLGHWWGQAQLAFDAQHIAYGYVLKAIGSLVEHGKVLFDKIGDMSQKIGERAMRILVRLGTKLLSLVKRIGSRFGGWFAWAKTAYDVATKGIDAISDIWYDIKDCIEQVKNIMELAEKVRAWVSDSIGKLKALGDLDSLMEQLPQVAEVALKDLTTPGPSIQEKLDAQVGAHKNKPKSKAEQDLEQETAR